MATDETTTRQEKFCRRGHYYSPPTDIRVTDDVKLTRGVGCIDVYIGTAEALASAGLLSSDLFPGEPGQSQINATLRPRGSSRLDGESWWQVPGYMRVTRRPTGDYRISLTVSREEAATRAAAREASLAEAEGFAEWLRQQVPASLRALSAIARVEWGWHAERNFLDPQWLGTIGLPWLTRLGPGHSAAQVVTALRLLEKARLIEIFADRCGGLKEEDRVEAVALVDYLGLPPVSFTPRAQQNTIRVQPAKLAMSARSHLRLVWSAAA
jgi:hypothetical protein